MDTGRRLVTETEDLGIRHCKQHELDAHLGSPWGGAPCGGAQAGARHVSGGGVGVGALHSNQQSFLLG